ncbi:MAG TPA: hypothetical protein VE548_01400 [Nitrososphaeraceae archaeon]|nr:hypothetical protein [Nitrososphaeraceae archaeon]
MRRVNILSYLLQAVTMIPNINDIKEQHLASYQNDTNTQRRSSQVYFVMCNSCYWCATYYGNDNLESFTQLSSSVPNCYLCDSHSVELMPISTDESFRIEYNPIRGVEIRFFRRNAPVM